MSTQWVCGYACDFPVLQMDLAMFGKTWSSSSLRVKESISTMVTHFFVGKKKRRTNGFVCDSQQRRSTKTWPWSKTNE